MLLSYVTDVFPAHWCAVSFVQNQSQEHHTSVKLRESFAQVMTGYIFEEISQATHYVCIRELMKQV